MMKVSRTIVFFGTEDFSLVALQGLIDSGYNVVAVVTKPDSKSGRGQVLTAPSVKKLAIQHGINVLQPTKVTEINDYITSLGSDVVGVLASYGKIIPESTINLFNPGIINIHPSLLPIYRGPTPIESAIINGDDKTGVSIMQLEAGLDSGPVYGQTIYQLSGNETRPQLYDILAKDGTQKLLDLMPSIIDGTLQPIPQNNDKAVYCNLLQKEDSWLQPDKVSAEAAERLVRGHLGFPKTKILVNGHLIIITKAHVVGEQKTALDIKCQDGKFLSVDQLIGPSGRIMSATDFLNGYKN